MSDPFKELDSVYRDVWERWVVEHGEELLGSEVNRPTLGAGKVGGWSKVAGQWAFFIDFESGERVMCTARELGQWIAEAKRDKTNAALAEHYVKGGKAEDLVRREVIA